MNTQIQVYCNPSDWISSTIQAVGVPGIAPRHTNIFGSLLPEAQKSQFQAIIDLFQEMGGDDWAGLYAVCTRRHAGTVSITDEEGTETQIEQTDAVTIALTASMGCDDRQITQALEEPSVLELYDTLVSPGFWMSAAKLKNNTNLCAN